MGSDGTHSEQAELTAARSVAALSDENPNPIMRIGAGGVLLYANAGCGPLLVDWGIERGEAVPAELQVTIDDAKRTGQLWEFEHVAGEHEYSLMVVPVAGADHVNLYGRDITDARHVEQQVLDLSRFPDENPNPVMRVDLDGVVLYSNRPGRVLLDHWGVTVGAALPEHVRGAVLHTDGDSMSHQLEVDIAGHVYALRFTHVAEAGYWNAYGREVSAQKRAEHDLIAARDAALEANRAKSGFLANMSHELRTPMNAVIGYSEMLMEELDEAGLPDFVSDLSKIHGAGRHLLGLINDMLDLSKIEAGAMDLYLEDFAVRDLLSEVSDTVFPLLEKNGNRLVLEVPDGMPAVHGDITKTRQILLNLLSNASKFTRQGQITVRVTANDELLRLEVTDTGIGMTAEHTAKVFDAFTQADSSTTKRFGGTGLGLTIAQRFAEMLGGRILVESAVDVGTTFSVVLPLRAKVTMRSSSSDSVAPTGEHQPVGGSSGTILVIDDDEAVRDIVGLTLAKAGYRVLTAASGTEGLRLAKSEKPVAITLDVVMQGMNGWNVLTLLKGDPETRDIPVVLATVSDERSLAYALGASEFMTKPIDRDRLVDLIHGFERRGQSGDVLVIEDDAVTAELMSRVLTKAGWTVRSAENGQLGLDALEEHTPQIIILDLMMPVMDGFSFLEHLRGDPRFAQLPVVVTTAKELTREERVLLRGSVERLIQKGTHSGEALLREIDAVTRKAGDLSR